MEDFQVHLDTLNFDLLQRKCAFQSGFKLQYENVYEDQNKRKLKDCFELPDIQPIQLKQSMQV